MSAPLLERLTQKFRAEALQGKTKARMPRFRSMRWLDPTAITLSYERFITATLRNWYEPFEAEMARIVANYFPQTRADSVDTEWDLVNAKLLTAQKELFQEGTKGNFLGAIIGYGDQASKFNEKEFQKFMNVALGENLVMDEPYLAPMLKSWSEENYTLIKTMSDQYIAKTNDIVKDAVSKGLVYSEVMKDLRKAGAVTTANHAKLVARDQIGKLNGKLTQARQEEAGIEAYLWDTSGDERVRGNPGGKYPKAIPSHFIMDKKVCRWDNQSVYKDSSGDWVPRTPRMPKVGPGQEIQCRCAAIPYMDEIWAEAANFAGMEATATDIPTQEQALTKLGAFPKIPGKFGHSVTSAIMKDIAGPNVLDDIPYPINKTLFKEFGEDKVLFFDKTTALTNDFSTALTKKYLLEGIPEDLIQAVRTNGKTYILPGKPNMAKLASLRTLGDYRARMRVVDLDKVAKKKGLAPKTLASTAPKVPKAVKVAPIPKPAPKPKPVKVDPVKVALKDLEELADGQPVISMQKLGTGNINMQSLVAQSGSDGINLKALNTKTATIATDKIKPVSGNPLTKEVKAYLEGNSPAVVSNATPTVVYYKGEYLALNASTKIAGEKILGSVSMKVNLIDYAKEASKAKVAKAAKLIAQKKATAKLKKDALKQLGETSAELKLALKSQQQYIKSIQAKRDAVEKVARRRTIKARPKSFEYKGTAGFNKYVKNTGTTSILADDIKSGKLTTEQMKSMRYYQGDAGNKRWAKQLRGDDPLTPDIAQYTKDLDTYIDGQELQGHVVLYRGIGLDDELKIGLGPGDRKTLFDPMFVSMASDIEATETFVRRGGPHKYILRFQGKQGDKIAPLVNGDSYGNPIFNAGETEFLAPRGTTFVVREITDEYDALGVPIVDVEILE